MKQPKQAMKRERKSESQYKMSKRKLTVGSGFGTFSAATTMLGIVVHKHILGHCKNASLDRDSGGNNDLYRVGEERKRNKVRIYEHSE